MAIRVVIGALIQEHHETVAIPRAKRTSMSGYDLGKFKVLVHIHFTNCITTAKSDVIWCPGEINTSEHLDVNAKYEEGDLTVNLMVRNLIATSAITVAAVYMLESKPHLPYIIVCSYMIHQSGYSSPMSISELVSP